MCRVFVVWFVLFLDVDIVFWICIGIVSGYIFFNKEEVMFVVDWDLY